MLTGRAGDDVLKSRIQTYGLADNEIALRESLIALVEPVGQRRRRPCWSSRCRRSAPWRTGSMSI